MVNPEKIKAILVSVTPQFKRMDEVIPKYTSIKGGYDLDTFEDVKRELIDILSKISDNHAKIKYFNTMYIEARKTKKAEVLDQLADEGVKITAAKETVYNEQEYKDYMDVVFTIEKVYNTINSRYYLILNVLDALQQSIAVARDIQKKN